MSNNGLALVCFGQSQASVPEDPVYRLLAAQNAAAIDHDTYFYRNRVRVPVSGLREVGAQMTENEFKDFALFLLGK